MVMQLYILLTLNPAPEKNNHAKDRPPPARIVPARARTDLLSPLRRPESFRHGRYRREASRPQGTPTRVRDRMLEEANAGL
jgi:hypothetical protein